MRRLLCLLAVLPAACGRPADAGRLLLDDGRRVAALAGADSTAVLFYDPSRCFSCGSTLPEWIAWRAAHPDQVRLILTDEPTNGERRQLRAGRAVVDGLVPGAGWMVEGRSMLVVLLVDGREAWSGVAGPSQIFTPQQARQ
jgi:predicted Fe-S protein YdhL (DUF1289 family)